MCLIRNQNLRRNAVPVELVALPEPSRLLAAIINGIGGDDSFNITVGGAFLSRAGGPTSLGRFRRSTIAGRNVGAWNGVGGGSINSSLAARSDRFLSRSSLCIGTQACRMLPFADDLIDRIM